MAFASDGNIIAVGANYLQNLDSGMWLLKVDVSHGDVLNVKKANPSAKKGVAEDVAVDSSGNIYVVGTEIKSDSTETTVFVRKFNSGLSLSFSRFWYVPTATGTGFNPAGITVNANYNPIVGFGQVNSPQTNFEQWADELNRALLSGLHS